MAICMPASSPTRPAQVDTRTGVPYVSLAPDEGGGHALAACHRRPDGRRKAGLLLNILPDGTCDVHPSSAGQDLLAKTIRLALIAGG
jgi:hypothetical protein